MRNGHGPAGIVGSTMNESTLAICFPTALVLS